MSEFESGLAGDFLVVETGHVLFALLNSLAFLKKKKVFQFVNVVYYIDWFVDIKESLHSWDKAHLVMMYDLFNMLLDSVW